METYCSPEDLQRTQTRVRRLTRVCRALAAGGFAAFVLLCCLTRTANMAWMFPLMMAVTIPLGWLWIGLYTLGLRPARGKAGHLEKLLSETPEEVEGQFFLSSEVFQIPGSARVRRVTLETEENPVQLYLDDEWADRAPADGTPVRVRTAGRYIVGIEDGSGAAPGSGRPARRRRTVVRAIGVLVPLFLLWGIAALIFGGFVFTRITDTVPGKKITIYADLEGLRGEALAAALEPGLPEPVRMARVHPFSYAMFDGEDLLTSDLYLVPASDLETYREWFAPLPEALRTETEVPWNVGDTAYGIPVHDPASGLSVADEYVTWPDEPCYLLVGARSVHVSENGEPDPALSEAIRALLRLP